MKFKSILLFFILISTSKDSFSQTGLIKLDPFISCDIPYVKLKMNDSIVFDDFYDSNTGITNLQPGKYHADILCDGEPVISYYQLEVFEYEITWIDYESGFYSEYLYSDEQGSDFPVVSQNVSVLYGPKFGSTLPFRSDNIEFKQSISILYPLLTHYLNFGTRFGTDFRWTIFDRDTLFTQVPDMKNERYFNWNLHGGVFIRLCNYRKQNEPHFTFDIGADYYLPLYFRHMYNIGNSKVTQRKIHHFNDFRLFARIGNSYIQVITEYRLFNYVRGGYPQTPKWIFGINFEIPTD